MIEIQRQRAVNIETARTQLNIDTAVKVIIPRRVKIEGHAHRRKTEKVKAGATTDIKHRVVVEADGTNGHADRRHLKSKHVERCLRLDLENGVGEIDINIMTIGIGK